MHVDGQSTTGAVLELQIQTFGYRAFRTITRNEVL